MLLGTVFGWISAVGYILSRIPQILENYERKSTEAISLGMFVIAVFGNTTYSLSIILYNDSWEELQPALPWLVGSLGTICFDFTINFQYFYYKKNNTTVVLMDDGHGDDADGLATPLGMKSANGTATPTGRDVSHRTSTSRGRSATRSASLGFGMGGRMSVSPSRVHHGDGIHGDGVMHHTTHHGGEFEPRTPGSVKSRSQSRGNSPVRPPRPRKRSAREDLHVIIPRKSADPVVVIERVQKN